MSDDETRCGHTCPCTSDDECPHFCTCDAPPLPLDEEEES